ncbi:MAG: MFS transporter [Lysobacteraceae bacterium]|nr:MAG: MFS transporter [Xanthomonadaceae bacterium]
MNLTSVSPARGSAASGPAWGAVLAMSLAAFVLVASEFMPVSLLSPIAADLGVTEGQAGQAISVSGAFALLTSLCIPALAGRIDRRLLLLSLTLLMMASGTLAAFAPGYTVFMIGRAFIGVAIGGFWSLSAATAMRLVPLHKVPRALAILNGGNALATVVAAPLGSYLGAIIGWRGAFFALIPVAALALVWKMCSFPALPAEPRAGSGNVFALLKQPAVALGMAAASLFFMGQFTLFTYLRPFLETVTRVDSDALTLLLLGIGVAGLLGTSLIGAVLKEGLYPTVTVIPLLMAAIALALLRFGDSLAATAVLVAAWGLVATAAPVGWWTWLARTLPEDAERGGGLMVAVVQLAIAAGATVGGVLFDAQGYRATFGVSAAILVAAAVLTVLAGRAGRRAAGSGA